jgi:hypothetical protein
MNYHGTEKKEVSERESYSGDGRESNCVTKSNYEVFCATFMVMK